MDSKGSTDPPAWPEASRRDDRSPQRLSDDRRGAFDVGAADIEVHDGADPPDTEWQDSHAGVGEARRDGVGTVSVTDEIEHHDIRLGNGWAHGRVVGEQLRKPLRVRVVLADSR